MSAHVNLQRWCAGDPRSMLSMMRVGRIVVALCVLVTIVIGSAATMRARPSRQTSALVAYDDIDLATCVDAAPIAIAAVIQRWTFVDSEQSRNDTETHVLPVLACAPKTSPPWSRA